jgi:Holliday junction resolvasome RuvABC ATP-dependent DNA helicase subunit
VWSLSGGPKRTTPEGNPVACKVCGTELRGSERSDPHQLCSKCQPFMMQAMDTVTFIKMWQSVAEKVDPNEHGLNRIVGHDEVVSKLRSFADSYKKNGSTPGHILLLGGDITAQRAIANTFAEEYDLETCEVDLRGMAQLGELGSAVSKRYLDLRIAEQLAILRQAHTMQTGPYNWTEEQRSVLKRQAARATAEMNEVRTLHDPESHRNFPEMGLCSIPGALFLPEIHRAHQGLASDIASLLKSFTFTHPRARGTAFPSSKFTCLATAPSEADCPRALVGSFSLVLALQKPSTSERQPVSMRRNALSMDADREKLDSAIRELNALTGLLGVKSDIAQLANYVKVQQLRNQQGLKSSEISLHMVFYGNPGTGKTTVARIVARIYQSLGVLSKGHLVETDRSGLVAGYVGQTALKVQEVVQRAIGGVLFVDEAYALASGSQGNDFGTEAVDTLLKLMEAHRDDLIVIVAGYTGPMQKFLESNPGLKSRFNKYLVFDDYTSDQLLQIFNSFCTQSDYTLAPGTELKLLQLFNAAYTNRDETFGNARFARNVFEKAISNLASRVTQLSNPERAMFQLIQPDDVEIPTSIVTNIMGFTRQ